MKRRWMPLLLVVLLLLALNLTACVKSAATDSGGKYMENTTMDTTAVEEASGDMGYGGDYRGTNGTEAQNKRKMIYTARLELETTAFDDAVEDLNALTEQMGGYYEEGSIGKGRQNYRWAEYTVRIPAAQYNAFVNRAGELCHETWRNVTQDDVSEVYYDTAGRLATQQIKLERLQELLRKAVVMEDIITVENAISETEERIDELSGTLQHYDALVDYATVYITLNEVYKLSNVEEVPVGFGSRMGAAFADGWSNFVDGLEDLAVSLAYCWMYLLILAAVFALAAGVLRRQLRRRSQKRTPALGNESREN